jgi:hypothetical protein
MLLEFFISLEGLFAEQIIGHVEDPFCQGFNPPLIIRPQCCFIDGFLLRHHSHQCTMSAVRLVPKRPALEGRHPFATPQWNTRAGTRSQGRSSVSVSRSPLVAPANMLDAWSELRTDANGVAVSREKQSSAFPDQRTFQTLSITRCGDALVRAASHG